MNKGKYPHNYNNKQSIITLDILSNYNRYSAKRNLNGHNYGMSIKRIENPFDISSIDDVFELFLGRACYKCEHKKKARDCIRVILSSLKESDNLCVYKDQLCSDMIDKILNNNNFIEFGLPF